LCQNIEINTGPNQGVARIFAPRPPDAAPIPTDTDKPPVLVPTPESFAFFDPGSVSTNVLEQALVNDAVGILTLDIGRLGEQGLTIDIDWGDVFAKDEPNQRFQQINGLAADEGFLVAVDGNGNPLDPVPTRGAPVLRIEHFYSQQDILNSRANGREAATQPIQVRFAVRHHESILVLGNTVTQSPKAELFELPRINQIGVVSSTDNRETPREDVSGLENGSTAFVIPALSIPVAFFPTREVIPEIETPEFVVRSESAIALSQSTVETSETTTATVVSREEYFQIRVLSPDPEGEDLAPPQKLPDDALSGDKIQQLFESLPDGRYEIEYVLGEGNEQSILRVDVRNGEATIPDEELDEGLLQLKRLQGNPPTDAQQPDSQSKSEQPNEEQSNDELPPPVAGVQSQPNEPSVEQRLAHGGPVAAGVLLMSRFRRRQNNAKKQRLSVSSRFSARVAAKNSTSDERIE
jgi:hypothetical protein